MPTRASYNFSRPRHWQTERPDPARPPDSRLHASTPSSRQPPPPPLPAPPAPGPPTRMPPRPPGPTPALPVSLLQPAFVLALALLGLLTALGAQVGEQMHMAPGTPLPA